MADIKSNQTPSSFRQHLLEIAAEKDQNQRAKLNQVLVAQYADLDALIQAMADEGRPRAPGVKTVADFKEALNLAMLENDSEKERLAAAVPLADAYTALFYEYEDLSSRQEYKGGRSGQIQFLFDGNIRNNKKLKDLITLEINGRNIHVPRVLIPVPGGQPQPCTPAAYRVSVTKPGPRTAIRGAGLEPEFLSFLRGAGRLLLRSFQDWYDEAPADGSPARTDPGVYDQALREAWAEFDRERFEKRYCKPGDIPTPGIQRGHRLLRLGVTINQNHFRDKGCGGTIYEGGAGAPVPPELDYEELVRRYVDRLKPNNPATSRSRQPLTRREIVESLAATLAPTDPPEILQLFTAASASALRIKSFPEWSDLTN
ncbi:MAG: hypothetical protein GY940_46775, partial [bacterium]|nr:hypothetical protein [bacterium]